MAIPIQPVQSPALWRADEIGRRSDWIHRLSADEVAEIDAALAGVRRRGIGIAEVTRENFPLRRFAGLAQRALELLEDGPGMFLLRGLPVERHSTEDMRLVYWALGKYLGTAVTQSRKGDVLGDVRDLGVFSDGRGRGYQSNIRLDFHTDSCDVVGLLVLRTAKSGGLSKIASSVAIHNQLLAERPDLIDLLYEPLHAYSPRERAGSCWTHAVFSSQEGHFACKTGRVYFELAREKFPELSKLTPRHSEALELFQEIANRPDVHFAMMFQPGDLQLLNNYVTVHARTDFEDHAEADRRRHLLRLWLSVPNSRPLSPLLAPAFRETRAGALRGGYPADTDRIVFESLVE